MLQTDLTAPEIKSNEPPRELLTMRETLQLTRYSRPSIYRLIKDKKFPPPLKLTEGGKVLFVESEIRVANIEVETAKSISEARLKAFDSAVAAKAAREPVPSAIRTKNSTGTTLEEEWRPDNEQLSWVLKRYVASPIQIVQQVHQFRDYHHAKGSALMDWGAAWRRWWTKDFHQIPNRGQMSEAYEREMRGILRPEKFQEWKAEHAKRAAIYAPCTGEMEELHRLLASSSK